MNYDYTKLRKLMNSEKATIFDLRSYMNKEKLIENGFDLVFKLGEGLNQ